MSVPSTLLAMVDASVGGKTGFDYAGGKNRIGAFHQPSAVLVDFSLLGTLPAREFCSGAAELLKMALLEGPGGVARFEALMAPFLARKEDALRQLLGAAVSEKVRIVAADETDRGERIVLNLGHTLGHALESAGDYTTLLHGEAVGLGLLLEHTFGVRKGWTDAALPARIRAQLVALGLPTTVDPSLLQASIRFLVTDKKRHGDTIKLPLMQTTGKVIVREVDIHELGQIPAGDF